MMLLTKGEKEVLFIGLCLGMIIGMIITTISLIIYTSTVFT